MSQNDIRTNKIIFGDAKNMEELDDNSVHLVVTSPPYFNAPFDYPDLFESYNEFLDLIKDVSSFFYSIQLFQLKFPYIILPEFFWIFLFVIVFSNASHRPLFLF